MKASKEIATKIEKWEKLQSEAEGLYEELEEYFNNELGAEGFCIPFITDNPTGTLQNEDEYCDQTTRGEDWYVGKYYHQIEGSNKYVGYSFEI